MERERAGYITLAQSRDNGREVVGWETGVGLSSFRFGSGFDVSTNIGDAVILLGSVLDKQDTKMMMFDNPGYKKGYVVGMWKDWGES